MAQCVPIHLDRWGRVDEILQRDSSGRNPAGRMSWPTSDNGGGARTADTSESRSSREGHRPFRRNIAHHADVEGMGAGIPKRRSATRSTGGLRSAGHIMRGGEVIASVLDLISSTPARRRAHGDLQAQFARKPRARAALVEIFERYGVKETEATIAATGTSRRNVVRAEIGRRKTGALRSRRFSGGNAKGENLRDQGRDGRQGRIEFDWEGSGRQMTRRAHPVRACLAVVYTVEREHARSKCGNAGYYRTLHISAPRPEGVGRAGHAGGHRLPIDWRACWGTSSQRRAIEGQPEKRKKKKSGWR